jgi:hypothetical protein
MRPWPAIKRDRLKQNEFGFAGGGPVRIPKVYNGANKTFFWANVTGYRLRNIAATSVVSVPTAAMRAGDFSAHDINPIYDVLSTTTANGNPVRQQFSYGGRLNVLDPARISKVSAYFINKIPLPNLPGSFNNFVGTASAITNNWDFSIRGDQYGQFFQVEYPPFIWNVSSPSFYAPAPRPCSDAESSPDPRSRPQFTRSPGAQRRISRAALPQNPPANIIRTPSALEKWLPNLHRTKSRLHPHYRTACIIFTAVLWCRMLFS